MGFYYIVNGKATYIEKYDPLPDYDREERRARQYRRPEGLPRGWW